MHAHEHVQGSGLEAHVDKNPKRMEYNWYNINKYNMM